MSGLVDQYGRGMRDLRISVTDRCNLRCRYCMPAEIFGPGYAFLPGSELLSFEEILRLTRITVPLGVEKIRLTGGEPLLRRDLVDLVAMLSAIEGIRDIALTTNGFLLAPHAEELALAGLQRVTVSLDALDAGIFAQMNGVGAKVERVLLGIQTAKAYGLPVKINAVIQRGVNDGEVLPLARWAKEYGIDLRFIEFMDVGQTNGWKTEQVFASSEILKLLQAEFALEARDPAYRGEVARHWRHRDGSCEIGLISSVTQPFCQDCQRMRLSADGKLFTCLFSGNGYDVRELLRSGSSDDEIRDLICKRWEVRDDRYSELRGRVSQPKAEMSYLGG